MTRSKSNASEAFARALQILGRRDHSEAELREKLARFGFAASAIDAALTRCQEYDYLNDRRFAQARCRELLRSGRGVGPRVLLDLKRRGIAEGLAREALASAMQEYQPQKVFRQQLQRRFPEFDYAAADAKMRRRVVSYFQRRGFALDEIFAGLKGDG